jgi:hypothetical protein
MSSWLMTATGLALSRFGDGMREPVISIFSTLRGLREGHRCSHQRDCDFSRYNQRLSRKRRRRPFVLSHECLLKMI